MADGSRCINCGGPATLLCDFKIGGAHGGYAECDGRPYRVFDINKPFFTCDVPLCPACATFAGNVFLSGKSPGSESVDYCPLHAHGRDHECKPLTDDELSALRREIEAHYRRKAFYVQ